MIAVIDNYDSFTYNLVQYFGELGAQIEVFRNDAVTVPELLALAPDHILISPGPGTPDRAGISLEMVAAARDKVPLLGVCLGHQTIGQACGGRIIRAKEIMHGKLSSIHHRNTGVFRGLPSPFVATRYHSLVIDQASLPDCLEVTAWTEHANGDIDEIMGIKHRDQALEGVQFHPESISSEHGHKMLGNFLGLDIPVSGATERDQNA